MSKPIFIRSKFRKIDHVWNDYKDGKLCCSNCGLLYNEYLQKQCKRSPRFEEYRF